MPEQNLNTFAPTPRVEANASPLPTYAASNSVCVIGAGAFGGWTALSLLRKGYKVTLIDAWGAGNSRSSSGDETRVIRSTYGSNEVYFQLNVRALELWKETETIFTEKIFYNTGVLWLCYETNNPIIDDSLPFSEKYNSPYRRLDLQELQSGYPLINASDLSHAYLDPYGGYLKAREACRKVAELFIAEGGEFIQELADVPSIENGRLDTIRLANGITIRKDVFIYACGSWLPQMFPFLSKHLHCTKQEVYYFGTPALYSKAFDSLPVWIDLDGEDFYYGIPGNASRGFKIGVDKRGVPFNPTADDRTLDQKVLSRARKFLGHRFPALGDAPLLENRVCPYENSSTGNFILDIHPEAQNVYILGGGSGHGFKHGPALGELVADCMNGTRMVPNLFRIPY